ncbi:hypothetical protein ABMA79_03605 [Halobacteriovorax sp. HFRX-2_2]|uniref:hypothetical protein n=1 Tax=unclassified Halobacteriovorax TaxID=2639665 RepID=UPI00371AAC9A
MLQKIHLLNIQTKSENIPTHLLKMPGAFVLITCQRTIILTTSEFSQEDTQLGTYYFGKKAYHFLLETICGLQSKLKGESEIVAQFKEAFSNYLKEDIRSSLILRVLEKLFKDAKEVRKEHLIKIGQQSYAGITRRIIQSKYDSGDVLILGSGQLARDSIKHLMKKYNVYISARNPQKVQEIINDFPNINITAIEWKNYSEYFKFNSYVNTIGCSGKIFAEEFFAGHCPSNSIFVDLGSPSVIDTQFDKKQGVYRLGDILNHGKMLDEEKIEKLDQAKLAIETLVEKRAKHLANVRANL